MDSFLTEQEKESAADFMQGLQKERDKKMRDLKIKIELTRGTLQQLEKEYRRISGNSGVARSQNPKAHSPCLPYMIEQFITEYQANHPHPKRQNGHRSEALQKLARKCVEDLYPKIKGAVKQASIKKMQDTLRKIVDRAKENESRPLGDVFLERSPKARRK